MLRRDVWTRSTGTIWLIFIQFHLHQSTRGVWYTKHIFSTWVLTTLVLVQIGQWTTFQVAGCLGDTFRSALSSFDESSFVSWERWATSARATCSPASEFILDGVSKGCKALFLWIWSFERFTSVGIQHAADDFDRVVSSAVDFSFGVSWRKSSRLRGNKSSVAPKAWPEVSTAILFGRSSCTIWIKRVHSMLFDTELSTRIFLCKFRIWFCTWFNCCSIFSMFVSRKMLPFCCCSICVESFSNCRSISAIWLLKSSLASARTTDASRWMPSSIVCSQRSISLW